MGVGGGERGEKVAEVAEGVEAVAFGGGDDAAGVVAKVRPRVPGRSGARAAQAAQTALAQDRTAEEKLSNLVIRKQNGAGCSGCSRRACSTSGASSCGKSSLTRRTAVVILTICGLLVTRLHV